MSIVCLTPHSWQLALPVTAGGTDHDNPLANQNNNKLIFQSKFCHKLITTQPVLYYISCLWRRLPVRLKFLVESLDIFSDPGLSPSPCPNRPQSWLRVHHKRKKEGFGPRAETKITWAYGPPNNIIIRISFLLSGQTDQFKSRVTT